MLGLEAAFEAGTLYPTHRRGGGLDRRVSEKLLPWVVHFHLVRSHESAEARLADRTLRASMASRGHVDGACFDPVQRVILISSTKPSVGNYLDSLSRRCM